MINPNAIEHPIGEPFQDEGMGFQEDGFIFRAQADERVDVKKTPVTKILSGSAPEREPIILAFEQSVQLIRIRIGLGDDLVHSLGYRRLLPA